MPRSLRRVIGGSLAAALVVASATPRSAADEPKGAEQSGNADVKRLEVELDLFVEEAHRTRLAAALTGLGVGAALVPSGLVLLGRSDGISRALVIGMIVGGSVQIVTVPLLFIPTKMEDIRDEYASRGSDDEATVHATETEWRLAAEASRRRRAYVGTTMSIVGVLSLASGLTFLLASEGIFGMSRQTQYTWGGVMTGFAVPVTTIGLRFLLEWSPEETSWEAYRAMKPGAGQTGGFRFPSVAVVPVQSGALAFATMSF